MTQKFGNVYDVPKLSSHPNFTFSSTSVPLETVTKVDPATFLIITLSLADAGSIRICLLLIVSNSS